VLKGNGLQADHKCRSAIHTYRCAHILRLPRRYFLLLQKRMFPLTSVSRPALGPTQPPVQWVPGVLSPGVKRGRGVTLTIYPHLIPRSWMSRSYTSSPICASIGVLWDSFTFTETDVQNCNWRFFTLFHLTAVLLNLLNSVLKMNIFPKLWTSELLELLSSVVCWHFITDVSSLLAELVGYCNLLA
jgi:hypothetical protein